MLLYTFCYVDKKEKETVKAASPNIIFLEGKGKISLKLRVKGKTCLFAGLAFVNKYLTLHGIMD